MTAIPYVPPPPTGATVYSILAAADRILPMPLMLERITGGACRFARPLWPIALDRIAQALPRPLALTGDDLLRRHTVAPAFLPFLSPERADDLVSAMLGSTRANPHAIASANPRCHAQPRTLLACPICVAENPAWLRQHQLPGVVVCSRHPAQTLMTTTVARSPIAERRRHVDIHETQLAAPCVAKLSARTHEQVVIVATAMETLVSKPVPNPGPDRFKQWLRRRFKNKGLVTSAGKTDMREAQAAIASWLGCEFASTLGIRLQKGRPDVAWFVDLMSERRSGVFPLWAVLCSMFVEVPIAEALAEACDCPIEVRSKALPRRRGISAAHARFESARTRLTKLWPRSDLTVRAISELLNVSNVTVIRWAAALDLPFPRVGPTRLTQQPMLRRRLPRFADRVSERRGAWLEAIKQVPNGTSAARHSATKALYAWLSLYDQKWLQRRLRSRHTNPRKDYTQEDLRTARVVTTVISKLKQTDTPRRASATVIMRALGYSPNTVKNKRMRLTDLAVRNAAESWEEFTPRKLRWLHEEGRLSRRALTTAISSYPKIKKSPLMAPILSPSP